MEFTLKLADNKEIQSKFYFDAYSRNAWDRFNEEVKKTLKNPLIRYTLRYQDDEGDSVTLTSQNEWEEMVRTGAKEILISSPVPNVPIEFLPRNLQPILLSRLKFFTWTRNDPNVTWFNGPELSFDAYEKPYLNGVPLHSSPIKEESIDGFQGVSIQWGYSAQHPSSEILRIGYGLFFHSSQLRMGNTKGKLYWPNLIDNTDCIVFNGWIEYYGQPRQYWKGAVLDIESMLNEPQEILPPLDPQCIEHARQIHKYITQLTQLWNIGHRHVKQNVMLLQRFEGNVPLVTANLNS